MPQITYAQAIRDALCEEMRRDPRVFLLGEDIGSYGGAFGVTRGMIEEFGPERVRDTPISEAAITGAAVRSELLQHAAGHPESPAVAPDVLPENEHARVTPHLLAHASLIACAYVISVIAPVSFTRRRPVRRCPVTARRSPRQTPPLPG